MITVIINTTFTPYNKAAQVKPTALLWVMRNTGSSNMFINGTYRVVPYDEFGIDASHLAAGAVKRAIFKSKQPFTIEQTTQFDITFGAPGPIFITGQPGQQLLLIQTTFKIQRN